MESALKKRKQVLDVLDGEYWASPSGKRARKPIIVEQLDEVIPDNTKKDIPKSKKWTQEETTLLSQNISKLTTDKINWDNIAALIPSRTAAQCKAKYTSMKAANVKDLKKTEKIKKEIKKEPNVKETQLKIDDIFTKMHEGIQIAEGIFLGNQRIAHNEEWLRDTGIKAILNVTKEVRNKLPADSDIEHFRISVEDGDTDLLAHFEEASSFITKCLEQSKNVLVHCKEGKSRSPSIVIAHLMKKEGKSLKDAYEIVSSKHPRMDINHSFRRQLMKYERDSLGQQTLDFFPTGTRAAPVHSLFKREPLAPISIGFAIPKQEATAPMFKEEKNKENIPPLMSSLLF